MRKSVWREVAGGRGDVYVGLEGVVSGGMVVQSEFVESEGEDGVRDKVPVCLIIGFAAAEETRSAGEASLVNFIVRGWFRKPYRAKMGVGG